ncbi:MAG: hypothetical protein AB8F94_15350 [Saprospiraceae bacterium]
MWLRSPWCNTNKNLIRLFEKVKKHHPDFNSPKLTKEKLFKQILPNGKFSDRRMNNLLSEGYQAAERFIIFQNLNCDENLQKELLVKEFQNRHLEDWFFKESDKEIEKLESKEVKEWEDLLQLFRMHRRVYHHPNQSLRMKPANHTLEKMNEPIDQFYLLEKAAIINEKIFRNRLIKGENHDITLDLKRWLELSINNSSPPIKIYRMRFNYTEENFLNHYHSIRNFFLENFEKLNHFDKKVNFFSLVNDTSKLIRARVFDITEHLPLYKLGLRTEIIFNEGTLTYFTYAMIVAASNTKKDFTFTANFIETYSDKLESNLQEDGLNWAKAHTKYYQENLNDCLVLLLNHDFKSHYFQQITKMLTTQVYFDLYLKDHSFQSYLFNYFDSFEKWLLRENFRSQLKKKSFLRFVQVSRTLAKSITEVNFNENKIEDLLQNESNIQASEWLNRKIKIILKLKRKRLPNT